MARLLTWLLRSALCVAILMILIVGSLATSVGQRAALSIAGHVVSTRSAAISFGRLEGSLFGRARLDRIAIADRNGTWLEASNIKLAWSPLALLTGHLNVEELLIESVDLLRQPATSGKAVGSPSGTSPPMMRLTLERMQIAQLILREPVAGTAAKFETTASADLVDHHRGLTARLAVKRLDQPGAKVQADLTYDGASRNLAVKISASEPAGGLAARLLQMPQQPSLAVNMDGAGPLDSWQAKWSISASGQPFVAGRFRLDRDGMRHRIATDFSGYLQPIAPKHVAGLLTGKATGSLIGHFAGLDRIDVSHLLLMTDALELRGNGGFEPATSYTYGNLTLRAGHDDNRPIEMTLSNGVKLSAKNVNAKLSLPDNQAGRAVSLILLAQGLTHPRLAISTLELNTRAKQARPTGPTALASERIEVQVSTAGFSSSVPGLAQALGDRLELAVTGAVKPSSIMIKRFRLGDGEIQLVGDGAVSAQQQTGKARLNVKDLGRLSTLFGETLTGRLELDSTLSADVLRGGYQIALSGAARNLNLGSGLAARLVDEDLVLSGELVRDETGVFAFRDFVATGRHVDLAMNGRFGNSIVELLSTVQIADLSAVEPALAGAAKLEITLRGTQQNLVSTLGGTAQNVSWRGNAIEDLALRFAGNGPIDAHSGPFEFVSRVAGRPIVAKAQLTFGQPGSFSAQDIALRVGRNTLTGHARLAANTPPTAKLSLTASRLADLDVFLGHGLSGAVSGELELSGGQKGPALRLSARSPQATFAGVSLKQLKATAALNNLMTNIGGRASVTLKELTASNSTARNLTIDLRDQAGRMAFSGNAQVNGAAVKVGGSIKQQQDNVDLAIDRADMRRGALSVRLAERAQMAILDGILHIQQFRLLTGRGSIRVAGKASSTNLNLDSNLARVPANIANVFMPALGLEGAITGRARVTGTPDSPTIKLTTTWKQATAQVLRDNHIPPVTIRFDGAMRNNNVEAKIEARGPQALALSVDGGIKLTADPDMKLRVSGALPLELANALLAARATQVKGRAQVSGVVLGSPKQPKIDIKITVPDAALHDPASGIKLRRVVGLLHVTEKGLAIRKFAGHSEFGGEVALTGRLARADTGAARADLQAKLVQFGFNDRKTIAGKVDGALTLAGPLDALAARGNLLIRRLDVTVPATSPRTLTALNVKHINAPKRLARQAGSGTITPPRSAASRVTLGLQIDAANRIFVKGRGVDALLGGSVRIRGTSNAPVTEGAFVMQRGRLDILGRRLDFRRGRILFDGAAEPVLDMEAVGVADDATIIVTISGQASKPVFKFSSDPELPEDEVVARLLFNKALVGLSPLQIVQLAGEIDKLGGLSSGPSVIDKLKRSVGIDVLDVSTDKTGAATVSAGRYVTDKTFVGVKQGASAGSSRVIIDHDFTRNLKARGEVGADGNSKLGIGLEWDY